MVPTLTWGLVRSNFPFAISRTPKKIHTNPKGFSAHPEPDAPESGAHGGNRARDLSLSKGVLYHLAPGTIEKPVPTGQARSPNLRCPGGEPANGVGAGGGNRTRVISLEG